MGWRGVGITRGGLNRTRPDQGGLQRAMVYWRSLILTVDSARTNLKRARPDFGGQEWTGKDCTGLCTTRARLARTNWTGKLKRRLRWTGESYTGLDMTRNGITRTILGWTRVEKD